MTWNFLFFINSILLGVGLTMDAFSVSVANALSEPDMRTSRMNLMAGIYAFFQFAMPMIGWLCVHTIVVYFQKFQLFIPWIAFILLGCIGGKMLWEGIRGNSDEQEGKPLSFTVLIVQGIATSIDALSVGFTIAEYPAIMAFAASVIIAAVTYITCMSGLVLGKKIGTHASGKASILGGTILILIGIEILVKAL